MKQWLKDLLYSSEQDLQLRLFILSGIVGSAALFAMGLITAFSGQRSDAAIIILLMFALAVACTLLAYRFPARKDLFGTIVVLVAIFIMLPLGYVWGGGANSGTPVWFVIITVFIASVFTGRRVWIFLVLTSLVLIALSAYTSIHPEVVTPLASPGLIYVDTCFSAIAVGILVAVLMRYQASVYERENKLAQEQKEEIRALSEAQNRFFSSMSHEIRTPLNTIIGLNEMTLRDQQISEEVAENATNIQNASRMLLSLINDILDLSKIESGRMELAEVQYETSRMLSDVVNLLWSRAKEKNLRFEVNVGENIPSMLYGDEMRLKQVVINVLTNAIKYTNEGTVTLTVDGEMRGPNEFLLRVDVDDTGIGIRKEALPYLFDSFRRIDTERNRNVEGTGLGLAISKQLVDLMGGTISVDSIFTKGSHFQVEVVQKIVDANPMKYSSVTEKAAGGVYENIFEAPEAHVLIVDDNDMNRMVSRKLLRGTRVQTDVAASGLECLEKTAATHYDVIFMDHEMPEMNGIETMGRVRNQEGGLCKSTPIIALTANAGSDMNAFYINQGFQAYLAKPIHGSLLEATLLQFLPPELIERTAAQTEGETLNVATSYRKRAIAITVDCPCDIPESMLVENNIARMPFYIITSEGRFRDVEEIDSDNLFSYFEDGGRTKTSSATVEEYEAFFGDMLTNAETVIHLSVSSKVSNAYKIASDAAESFDNVHVIDSGQFSSGLGLFAIEAARLCSEGLGEADVIERLEAYVDKIATTVLVPSFDSPIIQMGMPAPLRWLIRAFSWEPVFNLGRRGMRIAGFHGGYVAEAPDKYIRSAMRKANRLGDGKKLFITYSGCSLQEQDEMLSLVNSNSKFEEVILQKASATVAANTWMHSFGIMYVKK